MAPPWWGSQGYQFRAEDDAGLSGEFQHICVYSSVLKSGRVVRKQLNFVTTQLLAALPVIKTLSMWVQMDNNPPPQKKKKVRFKIVVLSQRIDTACKPHLMRCSQVCGRKPRSWLHIPV